MNRMRITLLTLVLFWGFLGPSLSYAENLGESIIFGLIGKFAAGVDKNFKINIQVLEIETKDPIWGARVSLKFYRTAYVGRLKLGECRGKTSASTDHEGEVKIKLEVENCPSGLVMDKDGEDRESLYITVSAPGFATRQMEVEGRSLKVDLQRTGFIGVAPPLQIEYPKYLIDLEIYNKNFKEINRINERGINEKVDTENYFALKSSYQSSLGQDGLWEFLDKIGNTASLRSIPLLREILESHYPLPYKSVIYDDSESWRGSKYIYEVGREAATKAILNISDDEVDKLLPLAVAIHEPYLNVLKEAGIALTVDDYWDYLSGKYVARRGFIGSNPRPDQLTFVTSMLKRKLSRVQYPKYLLKLFKDPLNHVDRNKVAKEIIQINSPIFISEAKKILLEEKESKDRTAIYMARRFMEYLYKQGEYVFLIESLRSNQYLMKAYTAEDVKGSMSTNASTGEVKYLEIEESLITKMPRVTRQIKEDLEAYLKQVSTIYPYYRWWIRSLSYIEKGSAERAAAAIYKTASIEPYKKNSEYEKRYVLRGASDGKLTGLCRGVYNDLKIREPLKRDYLSVGKERIAYLYSSCPREFKQFVSNFNTTMLKTIIKNGSFEYNYGFGFDFRDSIWQGIEKYFPEDKAIPILEEHYCGNEKVIQRVYGSSTIFSERYPIKCLCETFKKELKNISIGRVFGRFDYLIKCFPQMKDIYREMRMTEWDREITNRSYRGFSFLLKGSEGYASGRPIFDESLRAFFLGSAPEDKTIKGSMIDWSRSVEPEVGLIFLKGALSSKDQKKHLAALYLYSFYPDHLTDEIIQNLEHHSKQGLFPDSLYAGYSLGRSNPRNPVLQSVCSNSTSRIIKIIEERQLKRYEALFGFDVILALEVCSIAGEEKYYLELLDSILQPLAIGRYETFQEDLERVISTSIYTPSGTIERMFSSRRPDKIIVGIRLAKLRKYSLDWKKLETLVNHEDSFVRLAAAKYIIAYKEEYGNLFSKLGKNTNRKVRSLIGERI